MKYAGGSSVVAEDTNTIYVASQADLDIIATNCNDKGETYTGKTIKVTADFTITASTWTPIGVSADATHRFSGTFDGGGHKIYYDSTGEISIDLGTVGSYGGLFGRVTSGVISNIDFVIKNSGTCFNVSVPSASITFYVGGVVGYLSSSTMLNCILSGQNLNFKFGNYVYNFGGFAGGGSNSIMKNCSLLNGISFNSGGSYNDYCGGGFVSKFDGGTIEDCIVDCDLTIGSRNYNCGIFAVTTSTIQNCVATGNITINYSSAWTGGNIGLLVTEVDTIKNCVLNGKISATMSNGEYSVKCGIIAGSATNVVNCIANLDKQSQITLSGDVKGYVIAGSCTNAYNCVVMDTGKTVTMSNLTSTITGTSNTTNGLYYVTSDTGDNLKKEATYTASSGAGTNGYTWNTSYKWDFDTLWFMDTKSIYNDGYPYLATFKSKPYITLEVTVNNDREYIIYMLDASGNISRQFVVGNGAKVGFSIVDGEKFTIKVYETLYLRCSISGESTLAKTYENLMRDTTIPIVLSGANNVNNWLVV